MFTIPRGAANKYFTIPAAQKRFVIIYHHNIFTEILLP